MHESRTIQETRTMLKKMSNVKGLKYVLYLMENGEREISYMNLYNKVNHEGVFEKEMLYREKAIPKADERTLREVRRRLATISALLDREQGTGIRFNAECRMPNVELSMEMDSSQMTSCGAAALFGARDKRPEVSVATEIAIGVGSSQITSCGVSGDETATSSNYEFRTTNSEPQDDRIERIKQEMRNRRLEKEKVQLEEYLHEVCAKGGGAYFQNVTIRCKKTIHEAIRASLAEVSACNKELGEKLKRGLYKGKNSLKFCFP